MRTLILLFLAVVASPNVYSQYFQFSQYNFTSLRINPAAAASSNYATASLLYRNQGTDGGFHLTSNFVNATYPFYNRSGNRWSGIGLSLMDDRSGAAGIFNFQEVAVSYAVNIPLGKTETISFGTKVLHSNRRINPDGLFTGSQYIEDRGFDGTLPNGEYLGDLRTSFSTVSLGLLWQKLDKRGNKVSHLGLSFFDFNTPDDAFMDGPSPYASTLVLTGSFKIWSEGKLSVSSDALLTRNASLNTLTAGFVTSYELRSFRKKPSERIDIITRYGHRRSAVMGVQLHRETFALGLSYDFPVFRDNVANTGVLELGFEWKKLVNPRKKSRRSKKEDAESVSRKAPEAKGKTGRVPDQKPVAREERKETDSLAVADTHAGTEKMSARLKHKQDSIHALVTPGNLEHEPLLVEETTIRFGFDFNSSELDENAVRYLDELAEALQDNPDLNVLLTGHTDNVGSTKFNLRLSFQRAEELKQQLVDRGIDAGRIDVQGKGLTEPLNSNANSEERALNRRVEMRIYLDE